MENPWRNIQQINNEYIAECDVDIMGKIKILNNKQKDEKKLKLEIIPQPYVGDPKFAVIYYLLSNPSPLGTENDYPQKLLFDNLTHKNKDHPFFLLNPKYKNTKAYDWWNKKLRHIIEDTNLDTISHCFFAIDYMAYFSKKYPYLVDTSNLPSQAYSCDLIKQAMKEEKIIVIARFLKKWNDKLPNLKYYPNTIVLSNPQNPVISENTAKDLKGIKAYKKIISKLNSTTFSSS